MHFLTLAECRTWAEGHVPLTSEGFPTRPSASRRYVRGPLDPNVAFCRRLEQALQPREACLLWVTDWSIWRSSENLHLYYRLRQSYNDHRMISDAPGHYFHDYEAADLISFLQLAILNGWDAHLLPVAGYARAFVSHDDYVDFVSNDANQDIATAFAAELGGATIVTDSTAA
jgi:hypothetical protein